MNTQSSEIVKPERLAYSIADAAEAFSISRSKMIELVRTGKIACIRIDRRVLISKAELERFLALREEETQLTERARQQLQARIDDLNKMLDSLKPEKLNLPAAS